MQSERWKQDSPAKASADRYVQCWSMLRSNREEAQCLTGLGSFRYGFACGPSAVQTDQTSQHARRTKFDCVSLEAVVVSAGRRTRAFRAKKGSGMKFTNLPVVRALRQ